MSWTTTKISEFLFERKGKYKPQDEEIQGLQRIEKIDFSGTFHIGDKSSKTNMILVKKGDLVISGINVAKGAMGIYIGENDVVATIHYSSYTFDESKINVDYFKRFLKSPEFIKLINEQVKGGIKTEIKPKHILPLQINLPDINTQNEIVANFEKVEEDMTELDREVEYQQNLLIKLKQSILQEAIEGKLTAKWREQNKEIEPASVLLEKVLEEKEQLIKEKKIKKSKPLEEISENEIPFKIPDNWEWCRLGEIINIKSGKRIHASDYRKEGIPFLRSGEIGSLGRSESLKNELFISQEKYNEIKNKFGIPKLGDILIACIGGSIGNTWVVDDRDFYYKDGNLVLLESIEEVKINYLLNYLKTPFFWKHTILNATDTSYNALTIVKLNYSIFPLPPLEEQKVIVNKIEKLFAICDELDEQINSSKQNTQTLMQAVLKEAFER